MNAASSSAVSPSWTTALSATTADSIAIRGYDLAELVGSVPFASVVHLLFTGELPDPATARLVDAVMVASIDHGAGTPSVLAARTAISGGATVPAAAAAGMLTFGEFHGAAVSSAMDVIATVIERAEIDLERAADEVVAEWRRQGRRLPGYGHRQHRRRDPRLDRIVSIAEETGVAGEHIAAALAIEASLTRAVGRPLPINIDGMMAAVLGGVGFPSDLGNALFAAARVAGILAHANEEHRTMPAMRRIDPLNHTYSGPTGRSLQAASAAPATTGAQR